MNIEYSFHVSYINSRNMKDAYYKSVHCNHEQLFLSADNIRPGRTQDGLLFQVMFDLGICFQVKLTRKKP